MHPGTTGRGRTPGIAPAGIVVILSMLLVAQAVVAQSPPCPEPPFHEIHDLSLSGDEPAQFRRLLKAIEEARQVEIPAADLAAVFVRQLRCLEEQSPTGAEPLADLLRQVHISIDHQGLSITPTGSKKTRRVRLGPAPAHRTARKTVQLLEEEADRQGHDQAAIRRAAWYLMTEASIGLLEGSHNMYTYADQLAFSAAHDRGRSYRPGFIPVLVGGAVMVHEVIDPRLVEDGLAVGDRVLSLNGKALDHHPPAEWYGQWFRERPFPYTVTVARDNGPARLSGQSIPHRHRTLQWAVHDEKAYVRIRNFTAGTLQEFRTFLRRTSEEKLQGLIIDLRNNGGGVQQYDLVDIFFTPTQTVASSRRIEAGETEHIRGSIEYCGLPLVLLVNQNSASMSEVFAAAVKQHERGTVVGETTYGKGVGQWEYAVGEEGRLALVDRALYYPGTEESWDGTGIAPHVPIEVSDEERKAVDGFLAGENLLLADQLAVDTALTRAIHILEEER